MFEFAEFTEPTPAPFWKLLRQIGVNSVVTMLHGGEVAVRNWLTDTSYRTDGFQPEFIRDAKGLFGWDYEPLSRVKEAYESAGLNVAVIEDTPPMDKTRLGLPGRDEEIEAFCTLLRNMGTLQIPVLAYNFMAGFDWMRTSTETLGRGGALVSAYDHGVMNAQPITSIGVIPEDRVWANFAYFLKAVIPAAEKANVRLALHPDDPPISPVRGLTRVMCSIDALERALQIVPSPSNALTFCQGNITLMTDDVPAAIRHFASEDKIAFVHFRDVRGTAMSFTETFHDDGPTDMLRCMEAYREAGYNGVMRSDHVPTLEGDTNDRPGYSTLGRLFAIGYMTGLRESVIRQASQGEGRKTTA
jgi:mannonate dehydratase